MNTDFYGYEDQSFLESKVEHYMDHPVEFLITLLVCVLVVWFTAWNGRRTCRRYYTTRKYRFLKPDKQFSNGLYHGIIHAFYIHRNSPYRKDIHFSPEDELFYICYAMENTGYGIVITKRSDNPIGSEKDFNLIASLK